MEFGANNSSFQYSSGESSGGGPSRHQLPSVSSSSSSGGDTGGAFDVTIWYPKYLSCLRYFTEVAQHGYPCQALAAFVNIKLPFQRTPGSGPHTSNMPTPPPAPAPQPPPPPPPPLRTPPVFHPPGSFHQLPPLQQGQPKIHQSMTPYGWVSLYPYIRRLVATGFDVPAILHGWFGDDWELGVGPQHEQERRNYLFAAKSGGWSSVKQHYDIVSDECIPYLQPLRRPNEGELEGAEETWSGWMAMEDWALGQRGPSPPGYQRR